MKSARVQAACASRFAMTGRMILLAMAALAMSSPLAADERSASGEAELAALLEGRVAGAPVDCILDRAGDSVQIVDGTALVFRRGLTIYVNRPDGARVLDHWDLPVITQWSGAKLCRLDSVELRDRGSRIGGPTLHLAQFVPYTRPGR